jgi:murein L,D-transpeptidase YafK
MQILIGSLMLAALAAGSNDSADQVVVNKSKRELLLLRHGAVIRTYRIALGRSPVGPKQRQGDGKTPEGSYVISGRNAKSAYRKSLRVSYPNAADSERARREGVSPGGDIMIHGLPNGLGWMGATHRLRDWTEGCIAVTDEEIEET